jgi:hypothetical protein
MGSRVKNAIKWHLSEFTDRQIAQSIQLNRNCWRVSDPLHTHSNLQISIFTSSENLSTPFPTLFSYYLTSSSGVPSANYHPQVHDFRDFHPRLAALLVVLGSLGAGTYLPLWTVNMVIFTQRHEFCDKEKNVNYLYLSLPIFFCGSLAMVVQGTCRGVQRKARLAWCAMLGVILTVILLFVYVGAC